MEIVDIKHLLYRAPDTNKYDFGHVLLVGGSTGMIGAPLLAAEASLRIGAGLVTIGTSHDCIHDVTGKVEEALTLEIPKEAETAAQCISTYIQERHVTVLAIGPGLAEWSYPLVRTLCATTTLPLVLDAGGLQAFRKHLPELQKVTSKNFQCILTPHTGEYRSLAQPASDDLRLDAHKFAQRYALHVVLKGDHTYIAHPDGTEYVNETGNPGLATAGSGDVLTGIIAGLLAQGFDATKASEIGVYIHGMAGDLAVAQKTQPGIVASDVISFLPNALHQISIAS